MRTKNKRISNKRGVSEMIGYVLLIAGVIAMSTIVYVWLKSYVPRETPECADGVSLFIQNNSCNYAGGEWILNLDIKNNGRFSINGYFVRATTDSNQKVAVTDISKFITSGGEAPKNAGVILFSNGELGTGDHITTEYSLDSPIFSVEITPLKFETSEGKTGR